MRWWLAAVALLAATATGAARPEAPPTREGTRLVEALETAPLAVVGQVHERAALDRSGWRATLVVESALVGDARPGTSVPITWEELASAPPPRFADGDRVLVALEPLTSGSLWRARFPDVEEYLRVRAVAQRGEAFLRNPSLGGVQQLGHYLRLPRAERSGATGQRHLLALAADAEPALAVSAAARLAQLGGAELEPGSLELALRALARADSDPALAAELLAWVERAQPAGLAGRLDQALAETPRPPSGWVRARGLLPGSLAGERLAGLLADPSPTQRAAAVSAAGAAQREELAALARSDPAPEVRSAALRRLARLDGAGALETLLAAFSDREASVRNEAARNVSGLGSETVPRLREVALGWPDPAPETAVLALRFSGAADAVTVLSELADAHPDPRIRSLAALAIGRPLGHAD
jgi:hypothetical protein